MIIATIGEKGGTGKTTLAAHFLTAYLQARFPEEPINLYEFDNHNNTFGDILTESDIEWTRADKKAENMIEALSSIEYKTVNDQNIIVDVGGSDNTDRFIDMISKTGIAEEIIYVVPEGNRSPIGIENTVDKIRNNIKNPKIVVALNRWSGREKIENEFKFFFGDDSMGLSPSRLSEDKDIFVSGVPICDIAIGLSEAKKVTMWEFSMFAREYLKLGPKEKTQLWGVLEGVDGMCSQAFYMEKTKELHASRSALDALDNAEPFFKTIDTISSKTKKQK